MGLRRMALLLVLCIAIGAIIAPHATQAHQGIDSKIPFEARSDQPLPLPPLNQQTDGYATVMLELQDPPALTGQTNTEQAQLQAHNQAQQQALVQQLSQLGATILFQTTLTFNGIAVSVPLAQVSALNQLAGVVAVHQIAPKEPASALTATSALAAATKLVWSSPGGATGQGVKIGVIDTGIDYTHAMFGGPGTPAAFSNPARVFPTSKVVGGTDFAGDGYDASGRVGSTTPVPDRDPIDCSGQGTHTAGLVAGFGVTEAGQTYTGPYSQGLDVSTFRIPPGIAPKAELYAYKIFGCRGTTALLAQAVERAVADGVQVLVIALGSPFGGPDDPDATVVERAVRAGVVVVAAIGDNNATFYNLNTPATARSAIAVGASNGDPNDPVALNLNGRGPQRANGGLKPDLVAPGLNRVSAAVGSGANASNRTGTAPAAAYAAGAAALVRELQPSFNTEQIKATLINSALRVKAENGAAAPPSLSGAGQINLSALNPSLLVYGATTDSSGGLGFGVQRVAQPVQLTRQMTIENRSAFTRNLSLRTTTTVTETGVTVSLPATQLVLPPHSTQQVPVTIAVDPTKLDNTIDPASAVRLGGQPRYFLPEYGGSIQLRAQSSGVRVRFIHAAATDAVKILLNNTVVGGALAPRDVGAFVETASSQFDLTVVSASDPTHQLLKTTITLPSAGDYSLFLSGGALNLGFTIIYNTPPVTPKPGTILLQVVNANLDGVAGAGPLDVYVNSVFTPTILSLPVGQGSDFIELPAGPGGVGFIQAGQRPNRWTLASWQIFDAPAGSVVVVGSGQTNNTSGFDKECQTILALIAAADDLAAVEFAKRAGDVDFFDRICTAGRRGVNAVTPYQEPLHAEQFELQLPFQIFPTAASQARATNATQVVPAAATTFNTSITNTGARNSALRGNQAGPQTPLVAAFELAATSGAIAGLPSRLAAADLRYVGVTSSWSSTGLVEDAQIFFGLASYGAWSTPNEVQYRIFIDANRNGKPDHLLLNTSLGLFSGQANDVLIVPIYEINETTGSAIAFDYNFWNSIPSTVVPSAFGLDVSPYQSSVTFLTGSAALLGLTSDQPSFSYYVEVVSLDRQRFGQVIDRVPAVGQPNLVYNLTKPALQPINRSTTPLAQRPLFVNTNGATISGSVNSTELASRGNARLLLLHLHNPVTTQSEVVTITPAAVTQTPKENKPVTLFIPFFQR